MTRDEALAYTAGFFDGEGCIHMRVSGEIILTMAQFDPRPLLFIQESLKTELHFRLHRGEYRLKTGKRELVIEFLEMILPYLVLKRDQALLAVKFLKTRRDSYWYDHEERKKTHALMKSLKKVGYVKRN